MSFNRPRVSGSWTAPAVVITACVLTVVLAAASRAALSPEDAMLLERADAARASGEMALFVHGGHERWYQPLAIYPTALLLRLGLSPDIALRLPAVFAGMLTVLLTYVLAQRVIGRGSASMWTIVFLLTTPAYVAYARAGGADLLLVPLVLAWCVCVLQYVQRPRVWLPAIGGVALGLCAYTQPAGVLTLATYFVLGAIVLVRAEGGYRAVLIAAGAIVVVMLPIAVWFVRFPESYPDTFGRWAIHAAHVRNPLEGLLSFARWHVLSRRVGLYWEYLSPTFLFGSVQMFTAAISVLIAVALWAIGRGGRAVGERFIVAGFLAAPIAGVLLDLPRNAAFALMYVPFGAMLAAYGFEHLRTSSRMAARAVGIMALAVLFLELTMLGQMMFNL